MKNLDKETARFLLKRTTFQSYSSGLVVLLSFQPIMDLLGYKSQHSDYYIPVLVGVVGIFGAMIIDLLIHILRVLVKTTEE